jgi:hypothetical protein
MPQPPSSLISLLKLLERGYLLGHHLSFDVCLGAYACAQAWSVSVGATVRPIDLGVLVLSVWLIYTADRLWDAFHIAWPAATARHRLHQQYFPLFLTVWLLVALLQSYFLWQMRSWLLLFWGSLLLVPVGMHQYWSRKSNVLISKELRIAILYTLGLGLLAMRYHPEAWGMHLVWALWLGSMAWLNLLLIAWYETAADQQDHSPSSPLRWGEALTRRYLGTLLGLSGLLGVIWAGYLIHSHPTQTTPVLLCVGLMWGMMLWLYRRPYFLEYRWRYRLLADAVFCVPLLLTYIPPL